MTVAIPGNTLAACADREQLVVMPETQSTATLATPYHGQRFRYDAMTDTYTCPHGQDLTFRGDRNVRTQRGPGRRYRMRGGGAVCRACPAFGECTTDWRQGRSLQVSQLDRLMQHHRVWMQSRQVQRLARRLKTLIEPVFAILNEHLNMRQFLLRGLANVTAEWSPLVVGFNLRTLVRAWRADSFQPLAGPPTAVADHPCTTPSSRRALGSGPVSPTAARTPTRRTA